MRVVSISIEEWEQVSEQSLRVSGFISLDDGGVRSVSGSLVLNTPPTAQRAGFVPLGAVLAVVTSVCFILYYLLCHFFAL